MADKETAAKKRPARRQLDVECMLDAGAPAVFYCSRCKKPFCEDCIGRETARKTLCLHCAGVEESIEKEAQSRLSLSFVKKKSFLFSTFGVTASVIFAISAYILFNDHLESDQTKARDSDISLQLEDISECRANLEILVAEALSYRQIMDRPPASLEELLTILDEEVETEDSTSFEPYIIESDDAGNITAHCPTPEEHGIGSIIAEPGKPARLIYIAGGVQP